MFFSNDNQRNEDKRKFATIYETYRHLMLKIANDILNDTFLAEDAVHDAFLKISKNMHHINDVESIHTKYYIITITKNAAIDIYRKRTRLHKESSFDELTFQNITSFTEQSDSNKDIIELLQHLPNTYQDVFILKYAHNLNNEEISKILQIPQVTVRQRLLRGKSILKKQLKK